MDNIISFNSQKKNILPIYNGDGKLKYNYNKVDNDDYFYYGKQFNLIKNSDLDRKKGVLKNQCNNEKWNNKHINDKFTENKDDYIPISCKCNDLISKIDKDTTIFDKNSDSYKKYEQSDLYAKSSDNTKGVNAYLWYYATNRLKNASYNLSNTTNKLVSSDNNIMNYLTNNILNYKAIVVDDRTDIKDSSSFLDKLGNFANIFVIVVAMIFIVYNSISILINIYQFFNLGTIQLDIFKKLKDYKKFIPLHLFLFFAVIIAFSVLMNFNIAGILIRLVNNNKAEYNQISKRSADYIIKTGANKNIESFTNNKNIEHLTTDAGKTDDGKTDDGKTDDGKTDDKKNDSTSGDGTTDVLLDRLDDIKYNPIFPKDAEPQGVINSKYNKDNDLVYGYCNNNKVPSISNNIKDDKKDKSDGDNCSDIKGNPEYIILSVLLFIIFGISYIILNIQSNKIVCLITYIICCVSMLVIIFIAFNFIDIINNGVDFLQVKNTCMNIIRYVKKKMDVSLLIGLYFLAFGAVLVFGILFILCRSFSFQKGSIFAICSIILIIPFFISCIFFIYMNVIFGFTQSILYILTIIIIRWVWIFGTNIAFNFSVLGKGTNLTMNVLSVIYNKPIEYMYKLYINSKNVKDVDSKYRVFNMLKNNLEDIKFDMKEIQLKEIDLDKTDTRLGILKSLELPTSIPWDAPGFKLIKVIFTLMYCLINSNSIKNNFSKIDKKDYAKNIRPGMNFIPELSYRKKSGKTNFDYISSNSQLFTSPFNLIFNIIDLFIK